MSHLVELQYNIQSLWNNNCLVRGIFSFVNKKMSVKLNQAVEQTSHQDPKEDIVDPWTVASSSDSGIDYGKLIERFGSSRIDDDLIRRIEKITGKPVHHMIRRGIFFSHRELDTILKLKEEGKPFYLYTGRGPSSESLHLGHLVPFIMTKYLQDAFDVPLVIQMSDDEKTVWKDLKVEDAINLSHENAKHIIAMGFDQKKTFIFNNLTFMGQCPAFYQNIVRMQKCVTFNEIKDIFGMCESYAVGKIAFPIIQAAPALSSTFPFIFGNQKVHCLVPSAIDQDPCFRMCRDVAPILGFPKSALIHSIFLPSLQGAKSKMSSTVENSAVFLTDTPKTIADKINKYAFSGGRNTMEEHKKFGGIPDIDVSYQLLKFFMEDDDELEKIRVSYMKGEMLTAEIKKLAIDVITPIAEKHQSARKLVTDEILQSFMEIRPLQYGGCN
ncbi:tryptophan--tRNA ligase, cytoplasmic-like [Haematobia irritans]|uniref:tryptophan--tRNA ligase, cytoplasmic-like n=1 Tax=Haematobia irritans TaxID=7368 RepID=UPI003F504D5B